MRWFRLDGSSRQAISMYAMPSRSRDGAHIRGFMLYDAYQAHSDVFGPIRLMAESARGWLDHPWPLIGDACRWCAARRRRWSCCRMPACRTTGRISASARSPSTVRRSRSARRPSPPSILQSLAFPQGSTRDEPTLLVVAPLSGHFSTLLRGTVETLLPDHDVYLTDWVNARNVPLLYGRFDLDDFVDVVIRFIRLLGPQIHVIAVCQPSVPVLAAVSLLAAAGDPCQPASMVLMGGPIDTRGNPTEVNRFADGAFARLVRAHGYHHGAGALSRRVPTGLSGVSAARRLSQYEFRPACFGALVDVPQFGQGRRRQRGGDPRLL